jgi:serine/threonine-protein kinase HipA
MSAMESELHVYADLAGEAVFAGRLFARVRAGKETASFAYDGSWLKRRSAFAFAPSLMLAGGTFHSSHGLFNAFADTAPDAWGRKLMRRHERGLAEKDGRAPRTLFDIDFLAGVEDETRLGALRFKDPEGEAFLARSKAPVPPVLELAALLPDRIEKGRETNQDVMLVLAPGLPWVARGQRPRCATRQANCSSLNFQRRMTIGRCRCGRPSRLNLRAKAGSWFQTGVCRRSRAAPC